MTRNEQVQAVIDGIQQGRVLETFDQWYADDVVMSENGIDERAGKAANRAYEEAFVGGVTFQGADVLSVVVDGDRAAIEWVLRFTPHGGESVVQPQVAIQTWRGDQIAREVFYHA